MNVPEEFRQLCISFYPHSEERYATDSAWIAGTVAFFPERDKRVVRLFLDELLSGKFSDAELERIWNDTSPTFGFRPGGHRIFLARCRDALA